MNEIRFSGSISSASKIRIDLFVIFVKENIKITKCQAEINSHICLMLSVYKSFHQTAGKDIHMLQDLTVVVI